MINVIGTVYFMLFLRGILVNVVESIDPGNVARQIANAHTIFNIVNVIVLFPFTNLLVKLIQMIILMEKTRKKALRVILINVSW